MANGGGEGGGPELAGFFGSGPVGPPVLLTLLAVIVGLGVYYLTFMAGPIVRRRRETALATDGSPGTTRAPDAVPVRASPSLRPRDPRRSPGQRTPPCGARPVAQASVPPRPRPP